MNKKLKCFLLFFSLSLSVDNLNAQGCAMCKAAVENGVGNEGFNDAILYLMLFPYFIAFAGIALFVYLLNKKKVNH